MDLFLCTKKQFLSSKSKEEIKSLILDNASIPKFYIKNLFIRPYQTDRLLCTFNNYSFQLTHFKYYSNEYRIIIIGSIVQTQDGTLIKIKARTPHLKTSLLLFFILSFGIGAVKNVYDKEYVNSILCVIIITTLYLLNYFLFKYESLRLIQVLSRLLNNEKPFLSPSLKNKPNYIKP